MPNVTYWPKSTLRALIMPSNGARITVRAKLRCARANAASAYLTLACSFFSCGIRNPSSGGKPLPKSLNSILATTPRAFSSFNAAVA